MEAGGKIIFLDRDVGSDSGGAAKEGSGPGWASSEGESRGSPDGLGGGDKEDLLMDWVEETRGWQVCPQGF